MFAFQQGTKAAAAHPGQAAWRTPGRLGASSPLSLQARYPRLCGLLFSSGCKHPAPSSLLGLGLVLSSKSQGSSRCHPPAPLLLPSGAGQPCHQPVVPAVRHLAKEERRQLFSLLRAGGQRGLPHRPPVLTGGLSLLQMWHLREGGLEHRKGRGCAGLGCSWAQGWRVMLEVSWLAVTPCETICTLTLFSDVNKGLFFSEQSRLLLSAEGGTQLGLHAAGTRSSYRGETGTQSSVWHPEQGALQGEEKQNKPLHMLMITKTATQMPGQLRSCQQAAQGSSFSWTGAGSLPRLAPALCSLTPVCVRSGHGHRRPGCPSRGESWPSPPEPSVPGAQHRPLLPGTFWSAAVCKRRQDPGQEPAPVLPRQLQIWERRQRALPAHTWAAAGQN